MSDDGLMSTDQCSICMLLLHLDGGEEVADGMLAQQETPCTRLYAV